MNAIEMSEYYADLLIKEYQGKPKAYDHVKAMVTPVLMPQRPVAGTVWTGRTQTGVTDTAYGWFGLAYGAGLWVAIKDSGNYVITSPDAITWTPRTAAANNAWYDVIWDGTRFVAVAGSGTKRVMTSANGIDWVSQTTPTPAKVWYAVAYGNGIYVAVGSAGAIMTSTDAVIWTNQTPYEACDLYSVAYGNGVFVAVTPNGGYSSLAFYSTDGVTWSPCTGTPAGSAFTDVSYGNGWFVAVSPLGSNMVMRSKDGITWEGVSAPTDAAWQAIGYGAGVFVAGGNSSGTTSVMTSVDGLIWEVQTTPDPMSVPVACIYGDDQFVVAGYNGGPPHFLTAPAPDWLTTPLLPLAVQDAFDLTTATGVQLDILGKYIGASRNGFTFSEAVALDDDDYRDLLNIINLRNALKADAESIQGFIHDNFEEELQVFDLFHMHMNYFYKKAWGLDNVAEYFIKLGLLPHPVGVSGALITTVPSGNFFGFCTYSSPVNAAVEPFNLYSEYETDRPWLMYNYEIEV